MRPQATRTNATLRALSLGVLLVPVLFLALFAAWSYREHYREAEGRMVRTLDLLQEHGSKVFETYDLLASYTDELLSGLSDDDVSAKEADLNERLRRYTEKLPQVQDVWVISASGRALVTANVFPVPRQIDFSDRGYFQALRDTDTNLYISEVLRGRVQNVTFFQFARRRPGADGSFNGVVAVSVQPNYFRDYYSRVAANGLTSGALQREDGFVLARFPALPANLEATRVNTAFLQARERNPEQGLYTVASAFDGVVRLIAYQRVPGYPIYVSVGLTSSVVRDAWLRAMIWPFALVLPAALALFGLTRLAISQSIRERIAVDRAAEEALRRERAEVERRRADALHRAYYDNTSEAQFVIGVHRDGRFTIEDRNPAHAAAFSFDLDEVRGRDVRMSST
jgi:two-component system NtrC family sensor kinase